MSLEAWENRKIWEQEHDEIEIKLKRASKDEDGFTNCDALGCFTAPKSFYLLGRVGYPGGLEVALCEEHDEDESAFRIFRRTAKKAGAV